MKVAAPEWMLVTSFNEFGEGTVVEPTLEFGTTYLDAMNAVFGEPAPDRRQRHPNSHADADAGPDAVSYPRCSGGDEDGGGGRGHGLPCVAVL